MAHGRTHANMTNAKAAAIVTEILKDRTSHSFAALAGWYYIPSASEQTLWDMLEAQGRLTHPKWRPWASRTSDIMRDEHIEQQKHAKAIKTIQQVYGIT